MDHRTVPIEVLRDFVRSQAELSSLRHVADEVGIARSTLHDFLKEETTPHPRVRRLLGLWYLQNVDHAHEIDVARPFLAALDILLAEVPADRRREAEQGMLQTLTEIHSHTGEPPPRWLEFLRSRPR